MNTFTSCVVCEISHLLRQILDSVSMIEFLAVVVVFLSRFFLFISLITFYLCEWISRKSTLNGKKKNFVELPSACWLGQHVFGMLWNSLSK